MDRLTIVHAKAEHLDAVCAIEARAHAVPWRPESIRRELDNPEGVFLVGLEGGTVAGYALSWIVVDEAHILNVAVAEDRRGRGIGRRLVERLIEESKAKGARCATLEVREGNTAAVALYKRLGFVEAGLRKRYYDMKWDAVVMWLYEIPA